MPRRSPSCCRGTGRRRRTPVSRSAPDSFWPDPRSAGKSRRGGSVPHAHTRRAVLESTGIDREPQWQSGATGACPQRQHDGLHGYQRGRRSTACWVLGYQAVAAKPRVTHSIEDQRGVLTMPRVALATGRTRLACRSPSLRPVRKRSTPAKPMVCVQPYRFAPRVVLQARRRSCQFDATQADCGIRTSPSQYHFRNSLNPLDSLALLPATLSGRMRVGELTWRDCGPHDILESPTRTRTGKEHFVTNSGDVVHTRLYSRESGGEKVK